MWCSCMWVAWAVAVAGRPVTVAGGAHTQPPVSFLHLTNLSFPLLPSPHISSPCLLLPPSHSHTHTHTHRYRSPTENIDLPAALLSRFDLMFLLLDKVEERERERERHTEKAKEREREMHTVCCVCSMLCAIYCLLYTVANTNAAVFLPFPSNTKADVERDTALAQHITHVHRHKKVKELDFEPFDEHFIRSYVAMVRSCRRPFSSLCVCMCVCVGMCVVSAYVIGGGYR